MHLLAARVTSVLELLLNVVIHQFIYLLRQRQDAGGVIFSVTVTLTVNSINVCAS